MKGFVHGSFDGTGLYFKADEAITGAEAAVIVCNVLGIKTDGSESVFAAEDAVPTWALPALNALYERDIPVIASTEKLTRAETVKMLYTLAEQ